MVRGRCESNFMNASADSCHKHSPASQTTTLPPFPQLMLLLGKVGSGLYLLCCEPPELGGSLICSCHGIESAHKLQCHAEASTASVSESGEIQYLS